MSDPVQFAVRGIPVPQGSPRAFLTGGKARVVSGASRPSSPLGAWRTAIATEAREAMGDRPLLAGPLTVSLWFTLPRPASHWLPVNGRRREPELRLDAPEFVATSPDIDKLARAGLDALTGVVFTDDRQVARLHTDKSYGDVPGVEIRVVRL